MGMRTVFGLDASGIMEKDIRSIFSAGYGRTRVKERDGAVTEITCHAKGIEHVIPETRILIDIGGQDSKAIQLDPDGNVRVAKNTDGLAVSMSGGVAQNKGVVKAVAESMNIKKVNTPETQNIIGALDTAIIAFERIKNEVTF